MTAGIEALSERKQNMEGHVKLAFFILSTEGKDAGVRKIVENEGFYDACVDVGLIKLSSEECAYDQVQLAFHFLRRITCQYGSLREDIVMKLAELYEGSDDLQMYIPVSDFMSI